ncbi:MAG: ATP-binding domain-containing protein, partial [Desulfovermiculus sp.]|nr:ATP-binding domain-containing protein [Desulfovermiculus sp.]
MPGSKFTLPNLHDLSKEQDEALMLPDQGQYLIVGGPGTGKSILALLRAKRYIESKRRYIFLVYNHVLHQAIRHLFQGQLSSRTWMGWFFQFFIHKTGYQVPQKQSPQGQKVIDWEAALKIVQERGPDPDLAHTYVIMDEGQDMPPGLYQVLINMGFENFFVLADQNQQLDIEVNSSRQDIEHALALSPDKVIELTENFRNSRAIARLAQTFYVPDPASPPIQLPEDDGRKEAVCVYEYAGDDQAFTSLIRRILRTADRDPSKLLAIFTPNNRVRERYLQALNQQVDCLQFEHDPPVIQTYYACQENIHLDFGRGGIMVLNVQSCKGLEFDTVFLADIDQFLGDTQNDLFMDNKRRQFYVMCSRACDRLILFQDTSKPCPMQG